LAVEDDFVAFELEACGHGGIDDDRAALDFEDLFAGAAAEVMMVALADEFVAGGFAAEVDGDERAGLDQGVEVAIDDGDAEARHVGLGGSENFLRSEGPGDAVEDAEDGAALGSVAFHGSMISGVLLRMSGLLTRPT
jgi:hypothetical protein